MNSGFYSACAGLRTQIQALEFIANNLANISTAGFRGQQPTFRSELLGAQTASFNPLNHAMNDFSSLGGTRLDLSPGNLQPTGNPLDVAIEGDGFFSIQTAQGTMYTRNGSFRTSPAGQLVTADGDLVMGENGPLTVPSGAVSISADGTLSVGGAVVGKLRVVNFPGDVQLVPQGNSCYSATDASARPAARASVRQAMLEASNVNPVMGMVNLISVQRHADMMQRALSTYYNEFNRVATSDLPRV